MLRFYASLVARLDSAYGEQSYFTRLKARLLAAFTGLLLVWIPLNVLKLWWVQPPDVPRRLLINAAMMLSAVVGLALVRRGRVERAGNWLAITFTLPAHAVLLLAPTFAQPLSVAIQLFAFDLVFLLLTVVFATRAVAVAVFVIMAAAHVWFHFHALATEPFAGTLEFAADTLLRDGLFALGFVFCLAYTLVRMIAAAHSHSEQALEQTRALNHNLEELVSNRTRELEVATRRAQESSRAKTEFLANMSHEIRTPLNGIVASADLLRRRTDIPADVTEHVRVIADSGDLLLKLLGDILDVSKIEAGQVDLERRPFELEPVVRDTVALLMSTAAEGGVDLGFTISPPLEGFVAGDSHRLRQVLLNLTANAVKFTAEGGSVQVRVTTGDAQADPLPVRFEVRDTGIGMDAATLLRIFDRFTQADSSTTRRFGGSGLGLAISSHLVQVMGGKLEVQSTPGRGSVFYFTLALPRVAAPLVPPVAPPAQSALSLNVLVVEDNPVNRKILAAQLTQLGCRHQSAQDGEEALALLGAGATPDLILMDCHMPRLDGWETTKRLRAWSGENDPARRRAAALPIVALTAAALVEERNHCLEVGMTDFLAKPVKLAELHTVLSRYLPAPAKP
jgi:two-component system, sensor histidine kinase